MMKMATGEGFPLRQGAGTGLVFFSVTTEASGSGTPNIGLFLGVSIFIRIFGVENKSGGPRVNHKVEGHALGGGKPNTLVDDSKTPLT